MTLDILAKAGVNDEQDEQARRAVKAFRALQPTLTSYARVLTGRATVRVEMATSDNGSTDGSRIFFRPPIGLGDPTPHDRHLCDKRDESGRQRCAACAIRESILVTIYHEIAHICFDSFATTTDADKRRAVEFAIKEKSGPYAAGVEARIKRAPSYITSSYMGLCGLINEYLPFLVNCLEDSRVNRELFKARQGVKRMFEVDTTDVFNNGFENRDADGVVRIKRWAEAPLNSQVMIGVFCKASGYDYSNWFHSKVVDALDDEELTVLIRQMDTIRSASGVYNLAFKVLARLRELGFCGTPQDPDPEPEPEPDPEPEDEEESSENPEPDAGEEETGGGAEEEQETSSGDSDEGTDPGEADGDDATGESPGEDAETDDAGSGRGAGDDSIPEEGDPVSDGSAGSESEATEDDAEAEGEVGDEQDGTGSGPDQDSDDSSGGEGEGNSDEEPASDAGGSGAESGGESGGSDDEPGMAEPGSEPDGDGGLGSGEPESGQAEGEVDEPTGEGDATEGEPSPGGDGDEHNLSSLGADSGEEPIDTGADDGYGGTEVVGEDDDDLPPMGEPDEVGPVLKLWGDHDEKPKSVPEQDAEDAVDRAIIQGIYFTKPSKRIYGVREHHWDDLNDDTATAWRRSRFAERVGQDSNLEIPESILQPSILRMRRAFTDNQIGSLQSNRKSGRVNRRVLGKRAWAEDPRLFAKKTLPGRKDYFVVLGMDISGSTIGKNIALEKRAVMAQATMLDRVGVPFAIYAHTGNYHDRENPKLGLDLEVYFVKGTDDPWNDKTIERLSAIGPSAANLDGHFLEFLRKRADESRATNKIIMYYSDGKMPAENHDEELDILTSEIKLCRGKNYLLLGVGIRTDSPARHGLETVQVDSDDDLIKVVQHLGNRLR